MPIDWLTTGGALLTGLMGGVQVGEGLRVQVGVRADVADPDADHLEALLGLGWMWTESTTQTGSPEQVVSASSSRSTPNISRPALKDSVMP